MKKILLGGLIICGVLFFIPVLAEESPTSTPELPIQTSTTTTSTPTTTITLSTTTIHLQIEAYDITLFDDYFTVTECPDSETGTTTTLNAWCVIEQIAEQKNWEINYSWGQYGIFLNKINQYDGSDFNWWGWYSELELGMTSLNAHLLTKNENLLLTYGTSPLKLEITTTTPELNTTTTISILEPGYDESWNSIWLDSTSSTLVINNQEFFTANGTYDLYLSTTTPYEIYGQKNNFINTNIVTLSPTSTFSNQKDEEDEDDDEEEEDNDGSYSGGGEIGGDEPEPEENILITDAKIAEAVNKILFYLKSQQNETGMIVDGTITDWAIMSFGANNQYAEDIQTTEASLLDYATNYDFSAGSDLNLCAAYPRHILALLAAGVATNNEQIQILKNKLKNDCYNNNLYGENGINDDIFGLISLLAIDENTNEPIIQDILQTILADQQTNGSFTWAGWPGADITGGAINALKYAENKGVIISTTVFSQAKAYLQDQQLADGGWGWDSSDVLTTSWVIMGISALGESQTNWFNTEGKNPWHPLVKLLNETGYYESAWVIGATDWFAEKHAIPALLGQTWPIILKPKQVAEPEPPAPPSSSSYSVSPYTPPVKKVIEIVTTTPTTAKDTVITTSTPTTTIEVIIVTSTPMTTPEAATPTNNLKTIINTPTLTNTAEAPTATTKIQTVVTTKPKIVLPAVESTPTTIEAPIIITESPSEQTLTVYTGSTPLQKTAKGVFGASAAAATSLGLYLGWRFLLSLV